MKILPSFSFVYFNVKVYEFIMLFNFKMFKKFKSVCIKFTSKFKPKIDDGNPRLNLVEL